MSDKNPASICCDILGVSYEGVKARGRLRVNTDMRRVISYVLRDMGFTYGEIGRWLNRKHDVIVYYTMHTMYGKEERALCDILLRRMLDMGKDDVTVTDNVSIGNWHRGELFWNSIQYTDCNGHRRTEGPAGRQRL